MQIDTTINIKSDILSKIARESAALDLSINKLISILITRIINNCSIKAKLFSTVKYQHGGDDIVWHLLHVSFSADIYEKALDLRKLMKMSVSFLIAMSVQLYLKQIIQEFTQKENTDNNRKEYTYISGKFNDLLFFSIFWNSPPKKIIKKFKKIDSGCYIHKFIE